MKLGWLAIAAALCAHADVSAQVALEPKWLTAVHEDSSWSGYAAEQGRPSPPAGAKWADDRPVFEEAARIAWRFAGLAYQPKTGLMSSLIRYRNATMWDVGSGLAVLYCAKELGLLPAQEYDQRMKT